MVWRKSSYSATNTWCVEIQDWQKSSYCGASGTCVETRNNPSHVEIRDSKNPDMPHIFLSRENFGKLLDKVKNG